MKIIIIGGVAGGATAAARLRRLNETDEIIIIEKDKYISYANCGLPYYIGDVIKEKERLLVQTVEGMSQRFNLDVRINSEVTSINRSEKKISIMKTLTKEVYEESYDILILSCGAKPIRPNIKGLSDADNIFTLKNVDDTVAIKDFIIKNKIKRASVIGGGFIGIEVAENIVNLGVQTTIIEKMPQVLRPLDFETAQIVHRELNTHGINLILNDGLNEFFDKGHKIKLDSSSIIEADIVIMALGVVPENALAKSANLMLGKRGHVIVSDTFNTFGNDGSIVNDIYAIGDMIEVKNPLDDSSYSVPLAWGANRQGRILADHINGHAIKKSRILGSNVLKVFDLTVASTGANEVTLKEKKIDYTAIHAHRANHASYYPNSTNISLKIIYDKQSGKIFGAQAIGREGVEKRIDVIATVMRLNGTIYDLSDLELCYAPPYSSAKDPVNILGYMAENIQEDAYKVVYHDQIDDLVAKGGLLIDVRTNLEYENGHISGAKNIPIDEFRNRVSEITVSKETPIYVMCQVGVRAYLALRILSSLGYKDIYNLSGGYTTYKNYKYQTRQNVTSDEHINNGGDDNMTQVSSNSIIEVDVQGLQCPGPLMATYKAIQNISVGSQIKVIASDPSFMEDVGNWCSTNGHTLISKTSDNGKYIAIVQKGNEVKCGVTLNSQENATIVVFSGDLDKLIASMIIAQGAAAQGKKVTMFFTFWGLNALRKPKKVKVSKTIIEKMFGWMMPRGADKMPLSNMNMAGIGAKMIKGIMKTKNVDDITTMMQKAQEVGVKFIACTMSMDLMGIKKEELIDGIEYAGVATYISKNENVGTTLFI